MQQGLHTVVRAREGTYVQMNSVIRNTYALLSLTLLFSAFTAWYSMKSNAAPLGLSVLPIYIVLLFLTRSLRNSAWGIASTFLFTGFLGYTLGPILNFTIQGFSNGSELVMTSLGLTGLLFSTLSAYALTTRKNFSYLAGFLLVAATLGFMLSILGVFFQFPLLNLAVSGAFVLIASGMILFETSQIIHGGQTNYIMATISLYVSIYNLFLSLLRILTLFSGRRN